MKSLITYHRNDKKKCDAYLIFENEEGFDGFTVVEWGRDPSFPHLHKSLGNDYDIRTFEMLLRESRGNISGNSDERRHPNGWHFHVDSTEFI